MTSIQRRCGHVNGVLQICVVRPWFAQVFDEPCVTCRWIQHHHEHADEIHRTVTREALVRMCETDEQKQAALDAAREAADAFNLLLDGVYNTWCAEKAALN